MKLNTAERALARSIDVHGGSELAVHEDANGTRWYMMVEPRDGGRLVKRTEWLPFDVMDATFGCRSSRGCPCSYVHVPARR